MVAECTLFGGGISGLKDKSFQATKRHGEERRPARELQGLSLAHQTLLQNKLGGVDGVVSNEPWAERCLRLCRLKSKPVCATIHPD